MSESEGKEQLRSERAAVGGVRSLLAWLREALRSPGAGGVLARGSIGSFAVRASAAVLLFGMHMLLARVLGVVSYGNYVYAVTWVQVLALFSAAGMDSASARYVAEYRAKGEPVLLAGFLRHARTLAFAASVAAAAALFGVVELLEPRLDPELVLAFRWGALLLPVVTLLEVRSGALRGFKRVVLARVPVEVLRPVLLIGAVSVAHFAARNLLGAPMVMAASVAAAAVGLVVIEAVLRRFPVETGVEVAITPLPRRAWSGVAFQLLLVAGFGLILGQTDTLMLGALRGTSDAGIYTVAVRLAGFVPFALISVNVMLGPQIAELHGAGRRRELQRVLTLGARASLGFAVPVTAVLVLWGGAVLGMFGAEFSQGRAALLVLVGGQLVGCTLGSVGTLMTMTGHQRTVAWVFGGSAVANIALNAALIPVFGMLGAAVATAMTMLTWNAVLVMRAMRTQRLDTTAFALTIRER
jgi:O-antigen/teichoic acid export membrane protein